MSKLKRMLGLTPTAQRSGSIENPNTDISSDEFWDMMGGTLSTDAGESVTPKTSLGYAPIYRAIDLISGDVAKLPLGVYERGDNESRTLNKQHQVFDLIQLLGRWNDELSAFKGWRRFMVSALLYRNAYAWIERDFAGRPMGLYFLLPDRTGAVRRNGKLVYVTEVDGKLWELEANDVLHVEGISIDGLQGAEFLSLFRHDIGLALAARKFKSKFFGNSANIGGVLQVPPGAKPESISKVQASMKEKFSSSSGSFKTLILRDGFRWFATQVDPKRASVKEINEEQTIHVAQMFGLDPSVFGVKGSVSYNSREQAKQDYYDSALSHWLTAIKSETNLKLLTDEERHAKATFIDYTVNALLWTDAKTRSAIAKEGINCGRFSPNQTLAWENMNPYEGGDARFWPLNMTAVDPDTGKPIPIDGSEPAASNQHEQDEGDGRQAVVETHRDLVRQTLLRVHGRLFGQAKRHAKTPVPDLITANRAACVEILEVPVRAAAAAVPEWSDLSADNVFDRYAEHLQSTDGFDEARDKMDTIFSNLPQAK